MVGAIKLFSILLVLFVASSENLEQLFTLKLLGLRGVQFFHGPKPIVLDVVRLAVLLKRNTALQILNVDLIVPILYLVSLDYFNLNV